MTASKKTALTQIHNHILVHKVQLGNQRFGDAKLTNRLVSM